MALEFDKEDLIYIKETLEWLSEHTVLINDSRTDCETEHSMTQNSLLAIERGLAQCSDENAALPLQRVNRWAYLYDNWSAIMLGFGIAISFSILLNMIENIVVKIALIIHGG